MLRSNGFASNSASNLAIQKRKHTKCVGDTAVGQKQTYNWFNHFKNGWISVDEEVSR
jgi:hypothetical protein